jgi:hypothetical protein
MRQANELKGGVKLSKLAGEVIARRQPRTFGVERRRRFRFEPAMPANIG